jgi:alanine dehydrogenase
MRIGVPKEIKVHEYRVGLTPASVRELTLAGHTVVVERDAGAGIGATDADYQSAGATTGEDADAVFAAAELIVKVKEPQSVECARLRAHHTLFTYLHLAPDRAQTDALLASGCTAIAYETVTDAAGGLPLLAPMSEVAGRMSIQVAATALQKANGGSGVLLGGVPGVAPGKVVILGGGVVGKEAARMAIGIGAQVIILDKSIARLRQLVDVFGARIEARFATRAAIEALLPSADAIIGAVLVAGAAAPKLILASDLSRMQQGSVLVDVAIDQGGCFETSHATTHADPTYRVDGIVHYCVANMPGAVARTSAHALNNATLPLTMALARHGWRNACRTDSHLAAGLSVHAGQLTSPPVGAAQNRPAIDPATLLAG